MKKVKSKDHKLYKSVIRKTIKNGRKKLILPIVTTFGFLNDPKQIGFRLSRHKFVAKMIEGTDSLEVGCQEGFTSLIMAPNFKRLLAIDFWQPHIKAAKNLIGPYRKNLEFKLHDILTGPVQGSNGLFESAFCMDVLEHINKQNESLFFKNICASLKPTSTLILGMPSKESQKYASKGSKIGHVNCKSAIEFRKSCLKYFDYVFLFSMNDEVVHTGFYSMAHYLIAVCCNPKK